MNSQVRHEELHSCRCPDPPAESLRHLHEARPVALDRPDGDHYDVSVGEELGGMGDSIMNFLSSGRKRGVSLGGFIGKC